LLFLIGLSALVAPDPNRIEARRATGTGKYAMANKPMTKTQLVAALAEKGNVDKATANRVLEALTSVITHEVAHGGAVTLPGLGKFSCRARPARMVRNPATGEQMKKAADKVAKVTIAKALKDVINA
jgi:DNA-binding protein HU-beta